MKLNDSNFPLMKFEQLVTEQSKNCTEASPPTMVRATLIPHLNLSKQPINNGVNA